VSAGRQDHDAGLKAVARVRGVRERDSRIGLQQALAITAGRENAQDAAQRRLDEAPAFVHGSSTDYHAQRAALAALAAAVRRTEELAASSRTASEEARWRWQRDRSRLRAVESLLERRAEARRADVLRREGHELDDIAGRLWLRRRNTTTDPGDAA
jgi:flagellar protein FliJ